MAGCAFIVSTGERMLPELHDGDGEAVSVVASSPVTAASSDASQATGVELAPHCVVATDAPSGAPFPSPVSHGGTHVDHCGHSHSAAQTPATALAIPRVAHSKPIGRTVALLSIVPALDVRPPIL